MKNTENKRSNDEHQVKETVGEQRAERTVDKAADQSFHCGRAAVALEEAAGDTAGRRIFFLIVDGEREEILPVLHRLGGSDGAEHNRLAQARDDRAIGLAGNLARFERQRFAAPLDRSEEHTSELQSLMRISYAVFCLNKTTHKK